MSINGDRDWTNSGNSGFKSTFVLMFYVIACRHCGTDVVFVEVTSPIDTPEIIHKYLHYPVDLMSDSKLTKMINLLVWVRSFGINTTIGVDISETLVHGTTVASHVTFGLGAVDQVLLRKRDKFASLLEMSTFK